MKKMMVLLPALLTIFLIINNTILLAGKEKTFKTDSLEYVSFYGKVVDAMNNEVLPFAAIEAEGGNISTVTNIDGEFILKISKNTPAKQLKISYLGYSNKLVATTEFSENKIVTIKMEPTSVQMQAITIRPSSPEDLVREILNRIDRNYSVDPVLMKAFYRETVKNRKSYVSISEAVVDIYKSGYRNDFQTDQVKLEKGRKSADVLKMDTVMIKLKGGPMVSLLLDIVKHPYILLTEEYSEIYDFFLTEIVSIDDKLHYVLSFNQRAGIESPYYKGKLYVEMESLAITEAEFELNTSNRAEAERFFVQKKPAGMVISPEKAIYKTKYVIDNGKWYFNYARAEVKFKVDWKKRLFNTYYTTMTEIAITDRKNEGAEKFLTSERMGRNDILDEMVFTVFDNNYWGEYNIIEPDQSIESAIKKLNKKIRIAE